MKITRMRHVQDAQGKTGQSKPAAKPECRDIVPVQGTEHARRAPAGFNRNRRLSAFLAHLALQYDGVSVRRQQRAERLNSAIAGYGAEAAMRNAPRTRPARNLKI